MFQYIDRFSAHELKVLLKPNTISPSSVAGASKIMGLFAGFEGIRSSERPKKIYFVNNIMKTEILFLSYSHRFQSHNPIHFQF